MDFICFMFYVIKLFDCFLIVSDVVDFLIGLKMVLLRLIEYTVKLYST
jgi:hypothetical protein